MELHQIPCGRARIEHGLTDPAASCSGRREEGVGQLALVHNGRVVADQEGLDPQKFQLLAGGPETLEGACKGKLNLFLGRSDGDGNFLSTICKRDGPFRWEQVNAADAIDRCLTPNLGLQVLLRRARAPEEVLHHPIDHDLHPVAQDRLYPRAEEFQANAGGRNEPRQGLHDGDISTCVCQHHAQVGRGQKQLQDISIQCTELLIVGVGGSATSQGNLQSLVEPRLQRLELVLEFFMQLQPGDHASCLHCTCQLFRASNF
mmetsp:Transcript_70062/g.203100  ORF Transcript_70062/g.203100 Transcript_70062/m.203100 type:complete len:260 (+) Transcript_70062:439-1218(+)